MTRLLLIGVAVVLVVNLAAIARDSWSADRHNLLNSRVEPGSERAQLRKSSQVVRFFTRGHAWMLHRRHRACRTVVGERRQPVCRIARRTLRAHRWLYGVASKRLEPRVRASWSAVASWYGPGLYGNTMACGGTLHPGSMVVAHRTLACFTRVRVCYRGRCVVAVVQDRGPFVAGREVDLGPGVATALGFGGVGLVQLAVLS